MRIYIYSVALWASLLLLPVPSSAAEKAPVVPTSWSNELQASTRSVIQAGIESEATILMTRAMIRARFEEKQIVQAQHIVAGTLEKALPVDPVMNKAYEGIAKQVPAASIVEAMAQVSSRYEQAYALVGQLSNTKEAVDKLGNALAASLAAGLDRKDAEQLVSQLQGKARDMSQAQLLDLASECVLTTRDMTRQGVSSDTATDVVSQAIQKEFSVQEIRSMRNTFMSQGAQGSMESLAQSYSSAIQEGKDPGASASRSGGGTDTAGGNDAAGGGSPGDSGGDSSGDSSGGGAGDSGGDAGSGGDSSGGNSGGGNGGSNGNGSGN